MNMVKSTQSTLGTGRPSAQRVIQLQPIAALARLLQQLESGGYDGHAEQYRQVASQLSEHLGMVDADDVLYSILAHYPAAGELYENLRYQHAGLCLHDIDQTMRAERATASVLAKAGVFAFILK